MATVIVLPSREQDICTLKNVRAAVHARATAMRVPEMLRIQALGAARRIFTAGSSSAWAVQAGNQVLRGDRRCTDCVGGDAA